MDQAKQKEYAVQAEQLPAPDETLHYQQTQQTGNRQYISDGISEGVSEDVTGHYDSESRDTRTESALTFYVAECMEFPVRGEVHRGLTLAEAAKALRDMPDHGMYGGKRIGFELQDGSEYAGSLPLVEEGQVKEESINSIAYYRDHPGLQAAIAEAKSYFPDNLSRENDPAREERWSVPARNEEKAMSEKESAGGKERIEAAYVNEPAGRKQSAFEKKPTGRKESVLTALRAHQEKAKAGKAEDISRETTRQHRKEELSL